MHCSCNYKYGQNLDGYVVVPRSTQIRHAHKDNLGERYKFPTDEANVTSRLATCTCMLCGEEGKHIPRTTRAQHMSMEHWRSRSRLGDPPLPKNGNLHGEFLENLLFEEEK